MGRLTAFDRLFDEAAPLIREHRHRIESPPVDGGRWPVSVVLRPDQAVARRLEQAMVDTEVFAGPGHFRTGAADSVHFTVRALELYRESVDDRAVRRYAAALRRAARGVGPVALDLVGLTLAPGSVMVCAHPVDKSAARLMRRLSDELGQDAWHEAGLDRNIWYATLLHFGTHIAEPSGLVEWVAQRRDLNLGRAVMEGAELVRFRYEDGPAGRLMRPEVLATARTRTGQANPEAPEVDPLS
ncbi:MAG TPA: hypothetical protein VES02_18830 [Dermatophilaceae bacterium]|nr:hypothetical protein [Dermatophilaceae bacterium]